MWSQKFIGLDVIKQNNKSHFTAMISYYIQKLIRIENIAIKLWLGQSLEYTVN